ncbi:DUF6809 family protein [Radiobacillus sp. PE A8.2]|uniref:DUF6809 family protein n=1 Tax=Radiobacillus sp. PE A8.2 TaxID=3380349 RepID=UPI00388D1886
MKQMVNSLKIASIAKKKLPANISLDNTLDFATACYERGMEEVIKDIAFLELDKFDPIKIRNSTMRLNQVCQQRFDELESLLTSEQKEQLRAYEEAYANFLGAESGDHFIHGFISGYRYLKNQVIFRSDYGNEYDDDK